MGSPSYLRSEDEKKRHIRLIDSEISITLSLKKTSISLHNRVVNAIYPCCVLGYTTPSSLTVESQTRSVLFKVKPTHELMLWLQKCICIQYLYVGKSHGVHVAVETIRLADRFPGAAATTRVFGCL